MTTLGCPKNQVDSEVMLGLLARAGVEVAARPEDADCLVVNTCAFIEAARAESVETILGLAALKRRARARRLVVTGCLAQRYGSTLLRELPEVDAVLGTGELERIVGLVRGRGHRGRARLGAPGALYTAATPRHLAPGVPYAYVKIAEGCDMACTFCAIPHFRGRHRSRPLRDIVEEVEALARRSIREVILVSQDTLAWGRDRAGEGEFADLLAALSETSVPWIRVLYLHPARVTDRLIAAWSRARVLPYLDLPIQHGDDGILRAMRRGVTARQMRETIAAFRQAVPGLTVRTTVLVGFPGETEAAFGRLLEFLEEVGFDRVGVFTYSPEEGTPAMRLPNPIPVEVAQERAGRVQDLADRLAWDRQRALAGTIQEVLVDGPSLDPAFPWEGRTAGQAPEIDGVVYIRGPVQAGQFVRVRIAEVDGHELVGEPA